MPDPRDTDDEHYAPESGDRDEDQAVTPEPADNPHDADDEHYAPES